jgi:hypothetical protein
MSVRSAARNAETRGRKENGRKEDGFLATDETRIELGNRIRVQSVFNPWLNFVFPSFPFPFLRPPAACPSETRRCAPPAACEGCAAACIAARGRRFLQRTCGDRADAPQSQKTAKAGRISKRPRKQSPCSQDGREQHHDAREYFQPPSPRPSPIPPSTVGGKGARLTAPRALLRGRRTPACMATARRLGYAHGPQHDEPPAGTRCQRWP